jgi:hypothetical protein
MLPGEYQQGGVLEALNMVNRISCESLDLLDDPLDLLLITPEPQVVKLGIQFCLNIVAHND